MKLVTFPMADAVLSSQLFPLRASRIESYLLRYDPFAVHAYSFMGRASQLQPSRLVNNPGILHKKGDRLFFLFKFLS